MSGYSNSSYSIGGQTERQLTREEQIRKFAQKLAEECIQDWAYESSWENNDNWDTDFSEEEMEQIVKLALQAKVVLPNE